MGKDLYQVCFGYIRKSFMKKQLTIAVTIVLEKQVEAKASLRISQKREVRTMSKTFYDESGKFSSRLVEPHIDDMNKCKWLCDGVCCNDESECLADYPTHKCESIEECELFEKEECANLH